MQIRSEAHFNLTGMNISLPNSSFERNEHLKIFAIDRYKDILMNKIE